MRLFLALIVLIITPVVAGGVNAQAAPLDVIATTTILADIAAQVGGELVQVTPLLPANTDTHAYQFTPHDVARVANADLVLTVGAGYEAFLGDLLDNAGAVPTVAVSNGITIYPPSADHDMAEADGDVPALGVLGQDVVCDGDEHDENDSHDDHAHGVCDPHVWLAPANVMIWAANIADAFAEADPANADAYRANADATIAELTALDTEIRALVETLPDERRLLVTNHDVLGYFARAYDFGIAATVMPGLSTDAEPSPQALAALIDLIRAEGVPAIFAEVSANTRLAEIAAQEAGVAVITDLYTEALSDADGPASTYADYMRHNASVIVNALG